MAGENTPVLSASLTSVILKTRTQPNGFLFGIVENFSFSQNYATEYINGLGFDRPVQNAMHGISGASLSWGRAYTTPADDLVALGVAPDVLAIPQHESITVLFVNRLTSEAIGEVVDVLPSSIGINASSMSTLRENFSGTARFMRHGSELAA